MTNVIVRTTEDIIATLKPKQGIQCEENILYLFDPNVVVSITEATSREWLEQQSVAYLNEYIKPIMDAYEEEKEREIDAYVEEKQSTIFFDNTNFTGTTTAETINVTGNFSADDITTNTLTVLSSATIPAPTTDNNPATKKYVDDAVAGSTAGYHPNLFDSKWEDYILSDVQWLRADTFSWQDGTTYEVPYNHLVDDIDGKTLQSEIIAGITIQYYLADDKHKICPASEEANVLSLYTTTGVAWYYIIDTTNQRFKLPRTKFGFTGLRDAVGKYVEAGLPNITGNFNSDMNGTAWMSFYTSGAFTGINQQSNGAVSTSTSPTSGSRHCNILFNASDSNSIYGNSTTVQPPATQMYLYFYIGNFTQTAIENTAGLNASLFNDKMDRDFGNASGNFTVKAGTILPWACSTIPEGYLLCDGSAINRTTYADLFAVIGTTWGVGDGSTTFNVPQFVNRYPIGSGTNTVGMLLAQGLPNHTHNLTLHMYHGAGAGNSNTPAWDGGNVYHADWSGTATTTGASNSIYGTKSGNFTDERVIPYSAVVNFIIKY